MRHGEIIRQDAWVIDGNYTNRDKQAQLLFSHKGAFMLDLSTQKANEERCDSTQQPDNRV